MSSMGSEPYVEISAEGMQGPGGAPGPAGAPGADGTVLPVGAVIQWYGAKENVPADWLVMDGGTFAPLTFPDLDDLLGGNVLPDMTDRSPVGAGAKTLGSAGGNASVTLTTNHMPSHYHGMPHTHNMDHRHRVYLDPAISATFNGSVVQGATGGTASPDTTPIAPFAGNTGASSAPNTNTAGFGAPLNVQTPYLALWFIIKAR